MPFRSSAMAALRPPTPAPTIATLSPIQAFDHRSDTRLCSSAITMATEQHLTLGCDDRGTGEPALLLLTGWCSSRGRWGHAAPLLARHRRVVSLDWRGHGDSDPAIGDFGTREMVQ